jgi:hypothetical protein
MYHGSVGQRKVFMYCMYYTYVHIYIHTYEVWCSTIPTLKDLLSGIYKFR